MDESEIRTVDVLLHEIGRALGLKHSHQRSGTIAEGRMLAADYDNAANTIISHETPIGTADNEMLYGVNVNDVLDGRKGNDALIGKDGRNALTGGEGNDTITGGAGKNVFSGGDGNDTLTSGAGQDTIDGSTGSNAIHAGSEDDTVSFIATAGKAFHRRRHRHRRAHDHPGCLGARCADAGRYRDQRRNDRHHQLHRTAAHACPHDHCQRCRGQAGRR